MKFRTYGNIVELYTHEICYKDRIGEEETLHVEGCISLEHKEAVESTLTARGIEFTTVEVIQPQHEWLNGKEFKGGYDEALMASIMGQESWEQYCFEHDENAQLKAENLTLGQTIAENELNLLDLGQTVANLELEVLNLGGIANA